MSEEETEGTNHKQELLQNLKHNTWCRIGKSNIHGVGVIAIKDIPKDTNPFTVSNHRCLRYNCVLLSFQEVDNLPDKSVQKIITDFILPNHNGYYVPYLGFNSIDISFYMNHSSENNNVDTVPCCCGDQQETIKCEYYCFKTNRNIQKGEELLINYKSTACKHTIMQLLLLSSPTDIEEKSGLQKIFL